MKNFIDAFPVDDFNFANSMINDSIKKMNEDGWVVKQISTTNAPHPHTGETLAITILYEKN